MPLRVLAGALVVLALALAGCGSGHASGYAPGREGDIAFAQDMIPHHEQALELSELALTNPTTGAPVQRLARQIARTQDPELVLMRQWLSEWGAKELDHGAGSSPEGDDHAMPGMVSSEDMLALADATGADFDRRWLELMIAHHEGAVTMANEVAQTTADQEVKALAAAVVEAQAAEIDRMRGLLD